MAATRNIFFYKRNEPDATELYNILKRENLINNFQMVCMDDMPKIPPNIESPTLMVAGATTLFIKHAAFKWVVSYKFMKNQELIEQNKKIIIKKQAGPNGFLKTEMDGRSDTFAYTDVDMSQPKSYCGYGKDTDNVIYTAPEDNKLSSQEQNKRIHEITSNRQLEDSQMKDTLKKLHIEALRK